MASEGKKLNQLDGEFVDPTPQPKQPQQQLQLQLQLQANSKSLAQQDSNHSQIKLPISNEIEPTAEPNRAADLSPSNGMTKFG